MNCSASGNKQEPRSHQIRMRILTPPQGEVEQVIYPL